MKKRVQRPARTWSDAYRQKQLELARKFLADRKYVNAEIRKIHREVVSARRSAKLARHAAWLRGERTSKPKVNPQITPLAAYTATSTYFDGWTASTTTTLVDPSTYGCYSYYRTAQRSTTPNFALLKREKKRLPNTDYSARILSYSDTGYHSLGKQPDWTWSEQSAGHCCHINAFQPSSFGIGDCRDEVNLVALNRLHRRVNKMHVNVGQMFAERKQTVGLIVNNVNRIVSAARAVRHADWRGFEKALSLEVLRGHGGHAIRLDRAFQKVKQTSPEKRLASHWLEFTFGWGPLVDDIYGSAELLASHAVGDLYHEKASGREEYNRSYHWVTPERAFYLDVKTRIRYVVKYQLDSYGRAALSQTGLDNPALLAWELLPYSFVVDWVYNVSGYLKRLNTFDGFTFQSGTKSTLTERNMTVLLNVDIDYPGPQPHSLHTQGSQHFREVDFERQGLGTWPENPLPSLRNPLGNGPLWKLATSASLLAQVFDVHKTTRGA